MHFSYLVTPRSDGQWEVKSAAQSRSSYKLYASSELALAAAHGKCAQHRKATGLPCGVRLFDQAGLWEEHHLTDGDLARNPLDD